MYRSRKILFTYSLNKQAQNTQKFYLNTEVSILIQQDSENIESIIKNQNLDVIVLCYKEASIINSLKPNYNTQFVVINFPENGENLKSHCVHTLPKGSTDLELLSLINQLTTVYNPNVLTLDQLEVQSLKDIYLSSLVKLDSNLRVIEWNKDSEKIFQFKESEIIGESVKKFYPEFDDFIFKRKDINWVEAKAITKEGKQLNMALSISYGSCSLGQDEYHIIGKNISFLNQFIEELNGYRFAVEGSQLCICLTDLQGRICNQNSIFLTKYGFNKENVKSKSIKDLFTDENKAKMEEIWETLTKGKTYRNQLLNQSQHGEVFWVDLTITPLPDANNRTVKYMLTAQDITEKKEAEEEAKRNILIQKELKMKDEFLANMSHEIRTPLNVVLGYSDLLLETEIPIEQYKQVLTIKKSGKLLLSIINDILDLSKLESGNLVLSKTPFDLHDLFNEVRNMLELQSSKKDLRFILRIAPDVPKIVIGDSTRVEQILVNLINNAIKFTAIGFVRVEADLIKEESHKNTVQIKVIDSGMGIPKDKIQTIFESFKQSSTHITRKFGGTGLGLTIVKKLIEQLNGTINVESVVNEGSTFTISLPFQIPSNTSRIETKPIDSTAMQKQKSKESLNLNVLLAEDNQFNQILIQTRLHTWGCKVDIANNGLEALEQLKKNDYHLVIMDIQMPLMGGYEATERIRTEFNNYKSEIPIIALTADASNSNAMEAKKLGFNDYLFKPFNSDLLYEKLKEYGMVRIANSSIQESNKEEVQMNKMVDFSFIESEALGHNNIIKMMLESFLDEFELFTKTATQAERKSHWNDVYKAVHRVAPGVSNFNLKSIKPLIQELHQKSRDEEDTHTFKFLISNIIKEFRQLKPLFARKLEELTQIELEESKTI